MVGESQSTPLNPTVYFVFPVMVSLSPRKIPVGTPLRSGRLHTYQKIPSKRGIMNGKSRKDILVLVFSCRRPRRRKVKVAHR